MLPWCWEEAEAAIHRLLFALLSTELPGRDRGGCGAKCAGEEDFWITPLSLSELLVVPGGQG